MEKPPDLKSIQQAHQRIKPWIHRTPVMTNQTINSILKAELFFKCENMQKGGAFKFRGASNTVLSLNKQKAEHGVATHSSGNHGAALSRAARKRHIKAYIVMPKTAPDIKKRAVKSYGGLIRFCEPTQQAREETLHQVIVETGAEFVHPYNDYRVIAGQATCAVELFEDFPDPDYIITPVGGGGLLSGTALSTSFLSPKTKVLAAEPAGADDAFRSLKAGKILPSLNPDTIADGLRTSLGSRTFPIIQKYVEKIIKVSDESIIAAMRLILERMKILVETSAAVPLAALIENDLDISGKRIGVILTGGNVDLDNLPW
jgi:threonine dehydratase